MHFDSNFPDFKAKAVIDQISIEVQLARGTKFWYLQGELHKLLGLTQVERPIHVEAQGVSMSGDTAMSFVLTLQEHHHGNSAAKIAYVLHGLMAAYGFTAPPRTVLIEVAFDLWPRHDPKVIYAASAALKSRWALYGEDPRQVLQDGKPRYLYALTDVIPESTLYIGWHSDKYGRPITPVSGRAYPKITDRLDVNHKPIPLPPEQHRARVEVTLQGIALEKFDLTDPFALGSYDFTRLAALLHFEMFKPLPEIQQHRIGKFSADMQDAVLELKKHQAKIAGKKQTKKRSDKLHKLEAQVKQKTWLVEWQEGLVAALASVYRNTDMVIDWTAARKGTKATLQHSKDTTPDKQLNRKVKKALQKLTKQVAEGIYPSSI